MGKKSLLWRGVGGDRKSWGQYLAAKTRFTLVWILQTSWLLLIYLTGCFHQWPIGYLTRNPNQDVLFFQKQHPLALKWTPIFVSAEGVTSFFLSVLTGILLYLLSGLMQCLGCLVKQMWSPDTSWLYNLFACQFLLHLWLHRAESRKTSVGTGGKDSSKTQEYFRIHIYSTRRSKAMVFGPYKMMDCRFRQWQIANWEVL